MLGYSNLKTARVIKNGRRLGPAYILQYGYWTPPEARLGFSKQMNRRFIVDYEEFYPSKPAAEAALVAAAQDAASKIILENA